MQQKKEMNWQIAGLAILCIRFVQGFIFWGGGSRRFIYAPQKLDPYASSWMANKLQSAMPGALFDVGYAISFLLHHFFLLYSSIIVFSLIELLSGAALMAGFLTRAAALCTVFLSISLMIIFGWEGSTCLDEWTMAVSNLAMGFTLALSGSSIYSVDNWLMRRYPALQSKTWFVVLGSGPWVFASLKKYALIYLGFTIIFTLGTYNYYRGAIFSRYHAGPVSAVIHHIKLSDGSIAANGDATFKMYVNAGNAAIPSYILNVELFDANNKLVERWNGEALSHLNQNNIKNDYLYNQILVGKFGLEAPVSASAIITLPAERKKALPAGEYQLKIYTVGGHQFDLKIMKTD